MHDTTSSRPANPQTAACGRAARTPEDSLARRQARRRQAIAAWEQVLDQALQSGFFGTAAVEIHVQDGALQLLRRRLEQNERPQAASA